MQFKLFIIFTAFISCQRFLLNDVYHYIPLVILALSFANINHKSRYNTLILLSLLVQVDNGGDTYGSTATPIRYVIYILNILLLFKSIKINYKSVIIFIAFSNILVLTTITNQFPIHDPTLIRNIETLILVGIVFVSKNKNTIIIDFKIIEIFCISLIAAEIINVFIFWQFDSVNYLSYSSLKFIVVMPTFYYLIRNKNLNFILWLGPTILIIICFGTRMILLTYLFVVLFSLLKNKNKNLKLIFALLSIVSGIYYLTSTDQLLFYRTTAFVIYLLDYDFVSALELVDRVRFFELSIFLDRNILQILFGSGLGSGLFDSQGLLAFIPSENTAFTITEIASNTYYNLHETFIDLGLRFGMIFIFYIYFLCILFITKKDLVTKFKGMLLLTSINCAVYSMAGLILTAVIAKSYFNFDNKK